MAGDAAGDFSTSPNVWSLDDDRHGMNLSLQLLPDLDDGDDDERFEIVRGDMDRGEKRLLLPRRSGEEDDNVAELEAVVWRRREVSDMVEGRLIPLFRLCVIDSILFLRVFANEKLKID